jgi:hypothetical protein
MNAGSHSFYGNAYQAIDSYISNHLNYFISFKRNEAKILNFKYISILNRSGENQNNFNYDDEIFIEFGLYNNSPELRGDYTLFVEFIDRNGNTLFSAESPDVIKDVQTLCIPPSTFTRGYYFIKPFIHKANKEQIDIVEGQLGFSIIDIGSQFQKHGEYNYGSLFINTEWK